MKKLIFLSLTAVTLSSCNPIMMKIYGIKKPDIENRESITKKANKFGLDTTNIVSVSSADFPFIMKRVSVPNASIYDAQGKYVEYRLTDTSCNKGLFEFIPNLNLNTAYNKPDSLSLQQQWLKYRGLNGNRLAQPEPADFYVLIYWNVWTGKLNRDHVKIWEDLASANKNCRVKVIKVNLDIQDHWEQAEKEKWRKAFRKK
jgi:hypothetical protein